MQDLRSQLSPGWSPVNIALTIGLFLLAWPVGLLMAAYAMRGDRLGLDLARPSSFGTFWGRVTQSWQAARTSFASTASRVPPRADTTDAGGVPTMDADDTPSFGNDKASNNGTTNGANTGSTATSDTTRRDTTDA